MTKGLASRSYCHIRYTLYAGSRPLDFDENRPEAEFMNVQFRWGVWAQFWEFSDLKFPDTMFALQMSFKPFSLGGGGGGQNLLVDVTLNSKEENKAFVPLTSTNSASVHVHG
jgi:hypothetical protein